jgi:hypothetical protein
MKRWRGPRSKPISQEGPEWFGGVGRVEYSLSWPRERAKTLGGPRHESPDAGRGLNLGRQRHLCVGGDIADIAVVVDETDPAVAPLEPHYVARLRIGAVFEDRDHLPTLEPGRGERHAVDLGVQCEEQTDIRTADAKRV